MLSSVADVSTEGGSPPPGDLAALRTAYLDALVSGDAVRARHVMDAAADAGASIASLYLDVLHPVMEDVGALWSAGELNVAQEHYATAITAGVMAQLGNRWRRTPDSGRLAVVAATAGERHQLGAQMVADFLEAASWEVIPLGADIPAGDLAELVESERPDAVTLSTSMRENLVGAQAALDALAALDPRPFVVVGGRAWFDTPDERARRAGADARVLNPARLVTLLGERFPALVEEPA